MVSTNVRQTILFKCHDVLLKKTHVFPEIHVRPTLLCRSGSMGSCHCSGSRRCTFKRLGVVSSSHQAQKIQFFLGGVQNPVGASQTNVLIGSQRGFR